MVVLKKTASVSLKSTYTTSRSRPTLSITSDYLDRLPGRHSPVATRICGPTRFGVVPLHCRRYTSRYSRSPHEKITRSWASQLHTIRWVMVVKLPGGPVRCQLRP